MDQRLMPMIDEALMNRFACLSSRQFVVQGVILGLGCLVMLPYSTAWAQVPVLDQVSVIVSQGRVLGIHRGEGIARIPLAAGERIQKIEAKGLTGFVQTSSRLLGYSGTLQRWHEQRLDISEIVTATYVTSRLILVVGERRVYGFQAESGRWKREDIREGQRQVLVKEHVAVVITKSQALGFSAFTGGFFSQDLPHSQNIISSQANDNIITLSVSGKQFVFRSGLAIWAEVR